MSRLVRRVWSAGWAGLRADLGSVADRSRQRRARQRQRRFARARFLGKAAAALMLLSVLLDATVAVAADGDKAGAVWFTWLNATDSYGNTPAQYDLRVKQGGISDPIKAVGAFLLGWFWDIYRLAVSLMVWAFQFVLEFKFLEVVRVPANAVAEVIQDVTSQLGIVPLVAAVAVGVSGFRLLKGKFGAGFGEIGVTVVIVALLSTTLANPVGLVTGDNGLLATARDTGAELTANLLYPKTGPTPSRPVDPSDPESPERGGSAGDYTPATGTPQDQARSAMTKRMLDTFVRTPHQLLNFGLFIDQKKVDPNASSTGSATTSTVDTSATDRAYPDCFNAYNAAFGKSGGSVNDMTKGDTCPEVVKDTMEQPDKSLSGAWLVAWAVFWTLLLGLLLLVASGFLIGLAAWEAAKFTYSLLRSILPGEGRESVATGAATMIVAAFLAMMSVVLIGIYLITLNSVFNATSGWNPVVVYIFIDLVAVAFLIGSGYMLFRARTAGKRFGRKAADAMTPKSTPRAMAAGQPRTAGSAMASQARKYATTKVMTRAAARGGSAGNAGPAAAQPQAQTLRNGQQKSSTPTRLVKGTVKATGKAAKYAAMYTVGAPVAVPKAAAAAKVGSKAIANRFASGAAQQYRDRRNRAAEAGKKAVTASRDYAQEWGGNVAAAGVFAKKASTSTGRQQLQQEREDRRKPVVSNAQKFVDLQQRLGHRVDPRMQQRAQQANQALSDSRMTRFQRYEREAEQRLAKKRAAKTWAQRTSGPSARRSQDLRAWMDQASQNAPRPAVMPAGKRG